MAQGISVTDVPHTGIDNDILGTRSYAETLAEFIRSCDTPITIGIQGEWGSGKTSLLQMIEAYLEQNEFRGSYNRVTQGKDAYCVIKINTWEHSILRSPEESLISILTEISEKILAKDGQWEVAQKTKKFLGKLARGAVSIGANAALGGGGGALAADLMDAGESNTIKELRDTLDKVVKEVVGRAENPVERFVVFIDDLDRLEPVNAVKALELLKNIFSVGHCVYVLAIDYQVVVKGLKGKFGEITEANEWEFRAFFDKIIQVPFMMPIARYRLDDYMQGLLQQIGYYDKKTIGTHVSWLTRLIRLTVGYNPRSLKRMVNSLSLINIHAKNDSSVSGMDKLDLDIIKGVSLSLVCIQITYPRLFELLMRSPNFTDWDSDFAAKISSVDGDEKGALEKALAHAVEHYGEDFDEDWEKALFLLTWNMRIQRHRVIEMSKALSIIKDDIITDRHAEQLAEYMSVSLARSAVTSVVSFENALQTDDEDREKAGATKRLSMEFWNGLRGFFDGTQTCFANSIRPATSVVSLSRKSPGDESISYYVSQRLSSFIGITAYSVDPTEGYALLQFLKKNSNEIEAAIGAKVRFKIDPSNTSQEMRVVCPADTLKERGNVLNLSAGDRSAYGKSIIEVFPKLEEVVERKLGEYRTKSAEELAAEIDPGVPRPEAAEDNRPVAGTAEA